MWYYTLLPAHGVHPIPLKGWVLDQGRWGVTSGSAVTVSWEINEARSQKGSLRTVHICANQQCFVTTFFFLGSVRWDQKAQMCHCVGTYAGSSHTNKERKPKGQVTLATHLKSVLQREPRQCQTPMSHGQRTTIITVMLFSYHDKSHHISVTDDWDAWAEITVCPL